MSPADAARDPAAAPARLLVLPPSHFCERARWGLDAAGIRHVEETWAVGPYALQARRLAPGTGLPILLAGGRAVQKSGAILDLCGLTGGAPEVEVRFVDRVGPLARRFIHAGALADPRSGVLDLLLAGVPRLPALRRSPASAASRRRARSRAPRLLSRADRARPAEADSPRRRAAVLDVVRRPELMSMRPCSPRRTVWSPAVDPIGPL